MIFCTIFALEGHIIVGVGRFAGDGIVARVLGIIRDAQGDAQIVIRAVD